MMNNNFPFFEGAQVSGLTVSELDAVAELETHPGWVTVQKFLETLMQDASPAVYANADPTKQLLLHQGLGMIYVAANLAKFVSSAKAKADHLVQQEVSALDAAKQAKEAEV
ncbi:MAG: hypothetical protein M0P69_10525 [Bacteroidales bacterium]|jgi:hypothetical protein|nr:hypothetical protein [Bacteroidales bacterium]